MQRDRGNEPAGLAQRLAQSTAAGPALVFAAAFVLYWTSSFLLQARDGATEHFGSDAFYYDVLAQGTVVDRVARFHPVTVAASLAWMKLVSPLTAWISPLALLQALFSAVGAAGAWAATVVFTAHMPQRLAVMGGLIYASSFGVWYFSAIPESKIVTATLSVFYILAYVRLRQRWTTGGAVTLTAVLAIACLNEIVSCFLVAIPLVDTLMRRGFDWCESRWIALHALVFPAALAVLEFIVNGGLITADSNPESRSHFSMFLFYVLSAERSLGDLYAFAVNWLIFNVAAPTPTAPLWPDTGGYFEPSLAAYLASPSAVVLWSVLAAMTIASLGSVELARHVVKRRALLAAVAAFSLVRAAFFVVFNPEEALLFSPAVTLPHWMLVLIPFAASRFPAKTATLAALCGALIMTNARFIIGTS